MKSHSVYLLVILTIFVIATLVYFFYSLYKNQENRISKEYYSNRLVKIVGIDAAVLVLFLISLCIGTSAFWSLVATAALLIVSYFGEKHSHSLPPSPLKLFPEAREPYAAIKELLDPYLNAKFAKSIVKEAHQKLLEESRYDAQTNTSSYDTHDNYLSYLFNLRNLDHYRYDAICKTWAICFSLCHLDDIGRRKPLEFSEEPNITYTKVALRDSLSARLEKIYANENACPLVFLSLFAYESRFISELFDKVENYDERAKACLDG